MTQKTPFCLDLLCMQFQQCAKTVKETGDVNVAEFAAAMEELCKVFDALGSAFAFAFKDLGDKVGTLKSWGMTDTNTVEALLDRDHANNNDPPRDKKVEGMGGVSPSRALNRASHVCRFLAKLFETLQADYELELKKALNQSYDPTLAQIHPWVVKKAVKVAFNACPYRAAFLEKIDVSQEALVKKAPEFIEAAGIITGSIEGGFAKHEYPWIF